MTQYVINRLGKFGESYQWITHVRVFFKRENDPSGNGKICEVELSAPGPRIFASSRDHNFDLGAKETTCEIKNS